MKKRVIILKNGKHVELEWSFLVLEFLDEYPGGVKEIQKQIKAGKNSMKLNNMLCYAVIRANLEEPLTYNEIIKLLTFNNVKQIIAFIQENSNEFEDFKKKDQTYLYKKKVKKR